MSAASVAFLSLFLGLATGSQEVRVAVSGPVVAVEVSLDGQSLGWMRGSPWALPIELDDIAPHELLARGFDAQRHEVARARQLINLPRPPAETEVLLERGADGRAIGARLSWQSLTGEEPKAVHASLNGKALAISSGHRVALPAYDPEQAQILTVELEFENDVRARKDIALGGQTGAEAESELTAVPVRVRPGEKTPAASALRGMFQAGGRVLDVAAVEEGAGILVVVRDVRPVGGLGGWSLDHPVSRKDLALDPATAIRLLWPRPAAYSSNGMSAELFPASREFDADYGGLRWILTGIMNPHPQPRPPRFRDSVAVAGLNAYATFRRRAVLLVLEPGTEDASQYLAETVRAFLASLRVPLYVWSVGALPPSLGVWRDAVDVSSQKGLKEAFAKIRADLDSQRIVWVQGKPLPQQIRLAPEAENLELVR